MDHIIRFNRVGRQHTIPRDNILFIHQINNIHNIHNIHNIQQISNLNSQPNKKLNTPNQLVNLKLHHKLHIFSYAQHVNMNCHLSINVQAGGAVGVVGIHNLRLYQILMRFWSIADEVNGLGTRSLMIAVIPDLGFRVHQVH
jgi:hypothetical protein